MKKILYVLQQSIYNDKNKWLTADSNINMMLGMLKAFEKKPEFKNYQIDILIGNLSDFEDLKKYEDLYYSENVNYIPFNFPVNAFTNRQNFNVEEWYKLKLENYDLIINNITELSRNIKTIIEKNPKKYKKTKLITQCFWLDAPEINEAKIENNISYDWRQFDGFECSDLVTFTCQSTKEAFINNSKFKFSQNYIHKILDKSNIWDFGYSQDECNMYNDIEKPDKKRILFLNRLSELNYTHHIEFIEAIKILSRYRNDFEVIFTNPSRKIPFDWLQENCPNFIPYKQNKNLTRKEYWELLKSAKVSVHLFTLERYGGCALRESISSKNVPVVADCFEQSSIVNNENLLVEFVSDGDINVQDLSDKINVALDYKEEDLDNIILENYNRCSFEKTIEIVLKDIKKLLDE